MKRFITQFKEGVHSVRWQWYFIASFVPLCFLVFAITGYYGAEPMNGTTKFLVALAAIVSIVIAGSKAHDSQIFGVAIALFSIGLFMALLTKNIILPKRNHSITAHYGKVKVVAESVCSPETVSDTKRVSPLFPNITMRTT